VAEGGSFLHALYGNVHVASEKGESVTLGTREKSRIHLTSVALEVEILAIQVMAPKFVEHVLARKTGIRARAQPAEAGRFGRGDEG
jgi:hypothetical protein